MRVAMYYNNQDVRIEEIPIPEIDPGEILVKVMASGICGSDVMEWYRIKKAPLVLGHEIAGEIAEVGEGVTRYHVGDRVFVSHHIPCNTCYYCLRGYHTACETLHTTNYDPGGFAEYVRIPQLNVDRGVFPLPDELSFEHGVFSPANPFLFSAAAFQDYSICFWREASGRGGSLRRMSANTECNWQGNWGQTE
jgi:L-iditol 2-dehydrogenase